MPQNYDHRITGRIIRRLRLERGMSQEILSGLAALSRSHLAEIETGHTNANVETLWKISEAAMTFTFRMEEMFFPAVSTPLSVMVTSAEGSPVSASTTDQEIAFRSVL